MDWDLEAPGLHRFFAAKSDLPEYADQPGVINYFSSLRDLLNASSTLHDALVAPGGWRVLDQELPFDDYIIPDVVYGVDFMRAGRFDSEYPKLVTSFDWIEFFEQYGEIVRTFRELLASKFSCTLVDSRTGLTDVSGICTTLLPEKLVGVFTPNRQSLYGLCDIVAQAIEYRSKSDDFRPLSVFPLPSRVENAEKDLREQWRQDYQEQFENLFSAAHETERCDLTAYFDSILLPHVSYYAYGENIAVLQERADAISLSAAYQRFFERLMDSDYAWEIPDAKESELTPRILSPPEHPEKRYDAFLSYETTDAKLVSEVDLQLQSQGINSFLALRDLPPGDNWAAGIATAMGASEAIVVFVGPNGTGPWNDQESLAALENCAKDASKRIIPVLLPGAPRSDKLRLPTFLGNVQKVDFRAGLSDAQALGNLIWALTGKRPKLKDRGRSLRSRFAIAAIVLALLAGGAGLITSFLGNRALKNEVHRASEDLQSVSAMPDQLPSIDDLQKLDRLRQVVVTLSTYERDGVPVRLRWSLYAGDRILPDAKRVYFERLRRLLLAETQKRVTDNLEALTGKSASNAPNDSYQKSYDQLKAYLITTEAVDHDKSTKEFLTPVMMSHWVADRDVDNDRKNLATAQFDFYATELAKDNPYATGTSQILIEGARAYLKQFSGIDRNYAQLLSKAAQKDVSFNEQFPDSMGVIVSNRKVKGVFLRNGFQAVQDALKNSANLGGEEWVVGKNDVRDMNPDVMRQKLSDRYNQDFVNEWNTVLRSSSVTGYGSYAAADKSLQKLVGPTSPLLELFYFIAHNTDVAPTDAKTHFAPVSAIEPPGSPDMLPDRYVLPPNNEYVAALGKLQMDIHALAQNSSATNPALLTQAGSSVESASQAATKLIMAIPVDQQFGNQDQVLRLLQEPIKNVEALLKQPQPLYAGHVKSPNDEGTKRKDTHVTIRDLTDEIGMQKAYGDLQAAITLRPYDQDLKLRLDLLSQSLSNYYFVQAKKFLDKPLGSGVGLGWMFLKEAEQYGSNLDDVRDERTKNTAIHNLRSSLSIKVMFFDETSRRDSAGFAANLQEAIAKDLETTTLPVRIILAADATPVDPNFLLTGDVLEHRPLTMVTVDSIASEYHAGDREVVNEDWKKAKRDYEDANLELQTQQKLLEGAQARGKKKEIATATEAVDAAEKSVQEAGRKLDFIPKTIFEDINRPYTYTRRTIDLRASVEVGFRIVDTNGALIARNPSVKQSDQKQFIVLENVKPEDTKGVKQSGGLPNEIQFLTEVEVAARIALVKAVREQVVLLPGKILARARKKVMDGDTDGSAETYILYLNSTPDTPTPERDEAKKFLLDRFNLVWPRS
jgi:hypothetical protein